MSYDEVEIEDMDFVEDEEHGGLYTYPCPCGDHFQITLVNSCHFHICASFSCLALPGLLISNDTAVRPQKELLEGEEIARCPSCSLYITVIYDPVIKQLAVAFSDPVRRCMQINEPLKGQLT